MGVKRGNCRLLAVRFAIAALFGAIFLDSQAIAASSDVICGQQAQGREQRFATSETLRSAARRIETQSSGQANAAIGQELFEALNVPLESSEAADAAALAEYCTAAGEVMRRSPQGSQFQAQTYLLNGYRIASRIRAEGTASRAAFRLGLVSSSGSVVVEARGVSRSARRGSDAMISEIVQASETVSPEDDACAGLQASDVLANTNGYVAEIALQCATRRALLANDAPLAALASLRLARLRLGFAEAGGKSAKAIRDTAQSDAIAALAIVATVRPEAMRAELTGRLLATALDLGARPGEAFALGLQSMRAAATDPANAAYADAIEARLALIEGDTARAKALLGRAILTESQRSLPARLPEFYLLLAEAEPARRRQHAFAAYTALNNIRPLLPRSDPLTEESTFSISMRKVFESAVDAELSEGSAAAEEVRISNAQQIVESYRQAELQSVFGSECLPARNALEPGQLLADELLLYPILLPDRIELLYVSGGDATGGGVRYRRLPPNRTANRETVAKLAEEMVLSMGYGDDDSYRAPARRLYDLLIAPIEDKLRPGTMLAIIPDGALRAVPFAALTGTDGKYLIEKVRLSVAPALAFSQPGNRRTADALAIVAASLQSAQNLPAGSFSPLDGTAAEAQIAAGSSSGGQFIPEFKKADLVAALSSRPIDILHLATHASFNGRSDRAFVVANGETIPLSELRGLIAQSRARGDELALLVLSACETAVGDDEASMGLAGAAVQAGALSAIASLWQVNDLGTAELMKLFYGNYSSGASRSASLRDAQLALIKAGGDNADPNIWAAFTLLGAWR